MKHVNFLKCEISMGSSYRISSGDDSVKITSAWIGGHQNGEGACYPSASSGTDCFSLQLCWNFSM